MDHVLPFARAIPAWQSNLYYLFYTGIRSKETPLDVCASMTDIATALDKMGFTLRSRHAPRADRIDLLKLVEILAGSARLGATMVVNGRGWNAEVYAAWLLGHGMIPTFLPMREGRQKGVDYLVQQIIMDTPGTRAQELVLLCTDGEHFTTPLEHVWSVGVYTVVATSQA